MIKTLKAATILLSASILSATPVLAASDNVTKPIGISECDWNEYLKQHFDSSKDTDVAKSDIIQDFDLYNYLKQYFESSNDIVTEPFNMPEQERREDMNTTKPFNTPDCNLSEYLKQCFDFSEDTEMAKPDGLPECDWHNFLSIFEMESRKKDTDSSCDKSESYWRDFFEKHKTVVQNDDAKEKATGLCGIFFINFPKDTLQNKLDEEIDALSNATKKHEHHECECECKCCCSHDDHQYRNDDFVKNDFGKNEHRKSNNHIYHRWN